MGRRGPPRLKSTSDVCEDKANHQQVSLKDTNIEAIQAGRAPSFMSMLGINPTLVSLSPKESILLDHYIQRFSRTYPTCQGPSNPFLSTLLPFAMQDRIVLDALLALSGAQHWESDGMIMEQATLQLRHRALRGCQALLNQPGMKGYLGTQTKDQRLQELPRDQILSVTACCVLLLLYEKLVGNGKSNWMPHLTFLATIFEKLSPGKEQEGPKAASKPDEQAQILQFLYNLFLYNDLVHSTAIGATTLSPHYIKSVVNTNLSPNGNLRNRFYYPCLVAQIAAGNTSITDVDIDAWDGRLDWLPSFSSTLPQLSDNKQIHQPERAHVAQLYRYTIKILLRQSTRRSKSCGRGGGFLLSGDPNISVLADQAATSLSRVPEGSSFENALLWPIGIFARELTQHQGPQRQAVLQRLHRLERRFHMRHFKRMQEVLEAAWTRFDSGALPCTENKCDDVFLLG